MQAGLKRLFAWRRRGAAAAALTLVAFLFLLLLFPWSSRQSGSPTIRATDLQFVVSPITFGHVLETWSVHRPDAVAWFKTYNLLTLDSLFPAVYGLALAMTYAWATGRRQASRRDMQMFALPVVAAAFDYIENGTHLSLLWSINTAADVEQAITNRSFAPVPLAVAAFASSVKFALVAGSLIAIIVAKYFSVPVAPPPNSFADVLAKELAYIRRRRFFRKPPARAKDSLVGLALSGGGIRSATTNLGILQTLSKLKILPLVDYMSTVSGGGYIGSCLSSLLTLDTSTPPRPVQAGHPPLFTTNWSHFPFNPDLPAGADQLRHLRTHGGFLITRKGVLKRETLRSVGHLLSGTVYHLVLALLALSSISLLYMTVLFGGSPDVDKGLRQVTSPVRTYSPAYQSETTGPGQPAYTSPTEVVELSSPTGDRAFTIPVTFEYPSLWERLKEKARILGRQVTTVDATTLRTSLLRTGVFGILVCALSFVFVLYAHARATRLIARATPKPGESAEEAVAVSVLQWASYFSLAAILLWLGIYLVGFTPPAPLWLLLPVVAIGSILVTSWLLHIALPRLAGAWTRDMRSWWGAYQAMAAYAFWSSVVLAAMPVLVYALREHKAWVGFSGLASLLVARALTLRSGIDARKRPISAAVLHALLAVAIGVGLLLIVVTICSYVVPDSPSPEMWRATARAFMWTSAGLLALSIFGDANRLSPHYFYRDRLGEAYLYTDRQVPGTTSLAPMRDSLELPLSDLHGAHDVGTPANEPKTTAPFQLISVAINLASSRDLTRKDRKSGYFLFSKYFCGSRHTGFRPTADYMGNDVKLARALTVSGAAASSGIGYGTFFAQAFATVLFNLRLGYWMPNPSKDSSISTAWWLTWHFWPKWLWREITMSTDERRSLVNLSDGGHTGDNVGIYPLLQRRCKLIIACDAECDPSLSFGSFTEAIRHAYIDCGIDIDIDLTMLRPDRETGMVRSHCAVGLIRYPKNADGVRPVGYLVYVKNSLTGDEPEPILNYKATNPAFPHESTADQFFDDAQFESYRALGVHIAEQAFAGWAKGPMFALWRNRAAPEPRPTC